MRDELPEFERDDGELPKFERLDAELGPACPLSAGARLAQADAVVARVRRPRRAVRFGLLVAAALVMTTSAFAAIELWGKRELATPETARTSGPARSAKPRAQAAPRPIQRDEHAAPETELADDAAQRSPRDWLELANAARAAREFARAERLYLRVARLYPGTDDADAANLSAADLRSQHLGRPHDAIPLYRKLLAARPSQSLDEQARVGLARAYGAIGQRPAERKVWRELLREYPSTWFVGEARIRLAEP